MALAILLAKEGIEGIIIDSAEDIYPGPRAISLDHDALRILQAVGLEGSFDQRPINKVIFKSPLFGEIARVNTSGKVDGHPKLVTFFQPQLEMALEKKLKEFKNFELLRGVTFHSFDEKQGIACLGDKLDVKCRYLVGADGANSLVRKSQGLDFKKRKVYQEEWLIVDGKDFETKNGDQIEFNCDPRNPFPRIPAPGKRFRWEFKLNKMFSIPPSLQIERKAIYRFQASLAPRFSKRQCFLVGDAAHLTPPFAGQGLVSGLRDAFNLSWKLAFVLKKNGHQKILESYDQERRPHAKSMINLAIWAGRVVMPSNFLMAFFIQGTVAGLGRLPFFKKYLWDFKIRPKSKFKRGLFIKGGGLFPQVVKDRGTFRLFGTEDPKGHLSEKNRIRWKEKGGEILKLEGTFDSHQVIVVRPDQVIMHYGPIQKADKILSEVLNLI